MQNKKLIWKTERRKISSLIAYAHNPRRLTEEQGKQLTASLDKFNLVEIPAINTDGTIIAGHQRLAIMKATGRGEETVDVRVPNRKLTTAELKEYNLRSNKNTGEWDFDILASNFSEDMLKDIGFDLADLPDASVGISPDQDKVPEMRKTQIKPGDAFALRDHILMCGDSTDSNVLNKIMRREKADMVFTDPPYRMAAQGGSNQPIGRAAAKLGRAIKKLCDFEPPAFLEVLPTVFKRGTLNAYIFCNKDLVPDYLQWAVNNGYGINILFWKKPNAIPLGGQHRPDVEYLLFLRKSAIWNNACPGASYSKCLEYEREGDSSHPTIKPVEMVENEILISSNTRSIIVDFFGGSVTTLIACEKTGRKCRMIELEPGYCQVIVDRWEEFTGSKAKRIRLDK